jgi:hypothetical protein
VNAAAELYLDLLARTLTGMTQEDPPIPVPWVPHLDYQEKTRVAGEDWPRHAPCMLGLHKLSNVRELVQQVLDDDVPGDFLEAGVWRGGTCILMRAMLKVHGITDRSVWVADSFQGLPPHNGPLNEPEQAWLAVSQEAVQHNFELYGMLDGQVKFLPGWFSDSLPAAPVKQLAILRIDGDLYESQLDVLMHLYPKLSAGGFCIIDDYHFPDVARAVDEYRATRGVTEPMVQAGPYAAYWRRDYGA